MSSAGQANEAGSVARRDAATYFGVHMLAARPVEALENYKAITHVAFESSDPTDDIVLTFDGGSRAFASVKRKVTYGKPFIDTVDGWVSQLDENIRCSDLLVLVCEEAAEWVRDLADALAKLRVGVAANTNRHLGALERLDAHVPTGKRDEIRRRARIIELPRTATNNDGRTLLALMMDGLVEDNAGSGAVSAISESVHEWAGRALGFDAERLVGAIAARDIVVRADENGPAAAKAAAARQAVACYENALAASNGRVDLTLLADDLEPIVVENLLGSVRVRVTNPQDERGSEIDPWTVLRRNRRMLIVGQPGSGKSLTMRELAGWCAADPDAPTPVQVHLPDLLPRRPDHAVTVEDLVTSAAKRGPKARAQQVEEFLTRAIEVGDAILVLDGLDECRDRAAWMASQLRTLVAGLAPTTAVVVATRASAEIPAARIGLPRVDLARPGDLDATIDAVLSQCSEVRVADPEQRREWLRTRRDWLTDTRDNQAGMLQVPQLALLVTLIICSSAELEVPKERAGLLHEAVRQSVKRWEHDRFSGALKGTWATDLTPEMLLDGFVVLGRLMDGRDTRLERGEVLGALSDMLVDCERWGLSGAKARELGDQVLAFWDTHVAVYVFDEEGRLTCRSRVFTEIATAMWTMTCPAAALRGWATDAIRYFDSEGVVALALGLNPALVELLLELGESTTEATLAVAAAVRSDAVELTTDQLDSLVRQLGRHASQIESGARERPKRLTRDDHHLSRLIANRHDFGPGSWPLVEALCSMNLSEAQRSQRDEALAGLALKAPHDSIASAWVSLADANADERPLTQDEVALVATVLTSELPPKSELVKVGRTHVFTSHGTPARGIGAVAGRAIGFLTQLPGDAAEKIFKIAQRVRDGDGQDIAAALRRAGVETSQWEGPSPLKNWFSAFREENFETKLLDDIASLSDSNFDLAKNDRWSLSALSALLHATGYLDTSHPAFRAAFEHDDVDLRHKWLRALGTAYGIDLDEAAAEAAHVRAQVNDDTDVPPDWGVISCRSFERIELPEPTLLSEHHQEALLDCMEATSDWIAWPALFVLANTKPTWDTVAFSEVARSHWPPYRAAECYLLALLVSPEGPGLAARAAESDEPARRRALQLALQYRDDLDPTGELAAQLGRDDDLWVRGDYDLEEPAALYWTCQFCAQQNAPGKQSCAKCELGSHPERKRNKKTG